MARGGRHTPVNYNLPLVAHPITKTQTFSFPANGRPIVEFELTVTLSRPEQWVSYDWRWTVLPPAGRRAFVEAQVQLRKGINIYGDKLGTVRAFSFDQNAFYAGPRLGGVPAQRLHRHQLHEVTDFTFFGTIKLEN